LWSPDVAAPVLLLAGPFWGMIRYHSYGLWRPESLAVTTVLLLLGLACGLLLLRTRSTLLRVPLIAALILIGFDLEFNLDGRLKLAALAILALTWILRTHVTRIATVMAAAYLAFSLLFGSHESGGQIRTADSVTAPADLPPLFHLILDEHIGIAGIPIDIEGGPQLKDRLEDFYVGHGFRLFTRAYSHYYLTADAVPNALNLVHRDSGQAWMGTVPGPLLENAYFDRLRRAGYEIRVYQQRFVDVCSAPAIPVAYCNTIPSNSLRYLTALDMGWPARARFLATYWVSNASYGYRRLWTTYNGRLQPFLAARGVRVPSWGWADSRLGPAGALGLLGRMRQDVAEAPSLRGTAVFSHLLIPHGPYLVDAACEAHRRRSERLDRMAETTAVSAERRRVHYRYYMAQVQCLTQQLDRLLGAIAARYGDDAIVIVQGDHGSRLATVDPTSATPEMLTAEVVADYYSTLVAIREPGTAAGIDSTVVAVEAVLDQFSGNGFTGANPPADTLPFVFRGSKPGDEKALLLRTPLPPFWNRSRGP
jgi:hypothetical protein